MLVRDVCGDLGGLTAEVDMNAHDFEQMTTDICALERASLPLRVTTVEAQLRAVERVLGGAGRFGSRVGQRPGREPC